MLKTSGLLVVRSFRSLFLSVDSPSWDANILRTTVLLVATVDARLNREDANGDVIAARSILNSAKLDRFHCASEDGALS